MGRELVGRKIRERQVADFAPRVRLFQEAQRFVIRDLRELRGSDLRFGAQAVSEVNEYVEAGRAGTRPPQPR